MTTTTAEVVRLLNRSDELVREAHSIFKDALGPSNVEGAQSFRTTVSSSTDNTLVPKLVGAFDDDVLIGAMLGLYLRKLNAGMVLYAGVGKSFRNRGTYSKMREALLLEFAGESETPLGFILSEIEPSHWLARKYGDEWGGFIAPCDYVQPAVQRLPRRGLDLIVLPIGQSESEIVSDLPEVIYEIFRGVYRIAEPGRHHEFRRTVESVRT